MAVTVNLPTILEFRGHYEILPFQDKAREIIPGLKVVEVYGDPSYCVAVAYVGNKNEQENKEAFRKAKSIGKEVFGD